MPLLKIPLHYLYDLIIEIKDTVTAISYKQESVFVDIFAHKNTAQPLFHSPYKNLSGIIKPHNPLTHPYQVPYTEIAVFSKNSQLGADLPPKWLQDIPNIVNSPVLDESEVWVTKQIEFATLKLIYIPSNIIDHTNLLLFCSTSGYHLHSFYFDFTKVSLKVTIIKYFFQPLFKFIIITWLISICTCWGFLNLEFLTKVLVNFTCESLYYNNIHNNMLFDSSLFVQNHFNSFSHEAINYLREAYLTISSHSSLNLNDVNLYQNAIHFSNQLYCYITWSNLPIGLYLQYTIILLTSELLNYNWATSFLLCNSPEKLCEWLTVHANIVQTCSTILKL